jgi:hypothetical protein
MALRRVIGNHRFYDANFFENLHFGRVISKPFDKNLKGRWCILGCCYVKYDITAAQKKGANHG